MDNFYFQTFDEWKEALTVRCRIKLTPEYAAERIKALQNPQDRTTREFVKVYGENYLQQVIRWFEKAQAEH